MVRLLPQLSSTHINWFDSSRGRQRNVPKFKTHVQSDSFCSLSLLCCGVVVAVAVAVVLGNLSNDDGNNNENATKQ